VAAGEGLVAAVAAAILDGDPIDWRSTESSAERAERPVLDELRLVACLADVYRGVPLAFLSLEDAGRHLSSGRDQTTAPEHWGHLRLLDRIGRGAFGDVYRAWDTRLDREVALKLLPVSATNGDSHGRAIVDEGRLLARVRHPNVVTIYDADRIDNRVGLWMEFVKGRTLQQALEHGRAFSAAEVVEIGIELCHAVAAVHGAGLLHRDIKPHNVMLADDGRVVLMDFGTGRELGDTTPAGLAGTPLYLAPELLSHQEPTVRSDIYSLGVLLYHLLTGSYPVKGQSLRDLRLAHERRAKTDVRAVRPRVAPRLARIAERAIDPVAERRYQSADALRQDLARLKPYSRAVRLAYACGVAAACLFVIAVVWEAAGRRLESSATPVAMLARAAGISAGSIATTNPTDQPVIAVLPLENLSAEPDSDYLVDGLTDEIIRNLAIVQGLQVRSRTSSFAFKGKPRSLREVGEQLGANLVVEGSVLRSDNRLRINVQLVRVDGDVPLWAERFDRELTDTFAIQDEISRAIVNKLRLTVRSGQRRYDINVDTYNLYLKGRALLVRGGGPDAEAASEVFQQVIKKDPTFAPAYAGLVEAYGLMSYSTLSPGVVETALPLMQQAASTALELDELLAEGHAAMGFIYSRHFDWPNAEKSFRRAIDLNPGLTQTYINYWTTTLLPLERLDEAERLLTVAMRTDPLSAPVLHELGFMKLVAGRFDEAMDHYTRARALDPNLPYVDQHLGRTLTFAGRYAEALALWETRRDAAGTTAYYKDTPGGQPWISAAYVIGGRRAEVEQFAEKHREPYRLALIHAALGNKDRTFEELDRAAEVVPHRVMALLVYPEMRLLRGDPRLAALRKKLRLP
jgi:TolB-like protein/predicted Ser/Thr protein kinase